MLEVELDVGWNKNLMTQNLKIGIHNVKKFSTMTNSGKDCKQNDDEEWQDT
jgi:hypothetical protein